MKLQNLLLAILLPGLPLAAQQLTPHAIHLADGRTLTLNLPPNLTIDIAAQGLRRVRFLTESPDHRIFVTDMYNRADNIRGAIYILDGWNEATHTFARTIPYLQRLHNPNNLAFYTDPATHQSWLYVPLTDKLVRYKYSAGDNAPTGEPEILAHYPDYGLNYKYGGWHLTRTVAIANVHATDKTQTFLKLFVAVGSSCDACLEKEPVRASLSMMDTDGTRTVIVARGLRNAVGLKFIPGIDGGSLFATNMGADHLGDAEPEDTFFELYPSGNSGYIENSIGLPPTSGNVPALVLPNYGWPTCYFASGKPHADILISAPKPTDHIFPPAVSPAPPQLDCNRVPAAYTTFASHSSPLGLEYFDATATFPELRNSFLVALHGAGHPRVGTGYRVVRFTPLNRQPQDFITGFLITENGKPVVKGRPCGILRTGPNSFLLTDDLDGVVYSIHPR